MHGERANEPRAKSSEVHSTGDYRVLTDGPFNSAYDERIERWINRES